ncbi:MULTISPECIES: ferrous iron transporter B [Alteromonadaceae]|uniref:Ferrous iron transport protein B n=1 Tax=Brumicola blandensis TaxID=3075611 RepID=A0AAW8QYP2_9ALTE|nr:MULTISPECIES: ferrous iron transporter B [unclassified Alteromonas]MDT0582147.1 ferrous iron transporter B [Alteromonas sp. W409]MDT0627897.1 ferrous iron transporter B [Alteromonas sp. W364]
MQKIILVGKPNSGKSLLFNQLTGLKQKVANFPGVTVELKTGRFDDFEVVDFPGTYSLKSLSKDESIAIDQLQLAMAAPETSVILCNLDATRMERSLVFALQVQAIAKANNKAVVFTLNMIDELIRFNHFIDTEKLSEKLGSPVFAISARTLIGISELQHGLTKIASTPQDYLVKETEIKQLNAMQASKTLASEFAIQSDIVLKRQNKIDSLLLNSVFGGITFLVIMFFLFQSIFTWAAPLMDATEAGIGALAGLFTRFIGEGVANDFVVDAIFGGLGAFLVFVPQIMVLTLIIGLLEDSGYLARAALICHKPLSLFGLSGRSFIPYLSGHACAIPAILAARTIESPRKRFVTMMTVPLMSCSARLPVYALLIAVLVPDVQYLGGWVNLQGAMFFVLYFFGILTALVVSAVLNKMTATSEQHTDMPFILELPSYRLPHWQPLFYRVLNSGVQFIKRAAPIIFVVSLVIWVLGYFPNNGDLQNSYLATIGQFVEPIFEPLGIDWRYAVAILVSFLAREVFVGVLGTMFSIENADENIAGLAANLQADGLTLASGIALMAFYVIALQCVATVATLKAETGKNRYAWGVFVAYGLLAYAVSWTVYTLIA